MQCGKREEAINSPNRQVSSLHSLIFLVFCEYFNRFCEQMIFVTSVRKNTIRIFIRHQGVLRQRGTRQLS